MLKPSLKPVATMTIDKSKEALAQLKALLAAETTSMQQAHTRRHQIGALLIMLRKDLSADQFLRFLDSASLSRRTAERYVALAKKGYDKSPHSLTAEEVYDRFDKAAIDAMHQDGERPASGSPPKPQAQSPAKPASAPKPGATPGREPGDDTEAEAEAKRLHAAEKAEQGKTFNWKAINSAFGDLVRALNDFEKIYGKAPQLAALRSRLQNWYDDAKDQYRTITGEEPPGVV